MSTTSSTDAVTARLYGEPLQDLPRDLYIPPDALRIFLESFEGPLDLLLYLIRRQNFNVLDIPMTELTAQYLAYVQEIRRHDLDLASDYLLMAAVLIAIKSRMLLPVQPADDSGEEADPRAELVRRLLEYETMRKAAGRLDAMPRAGRDFLWAQALMEADLAPVLPGVCARDLRLAWKEILQRAHWHAQHEVSRDSLSVREHMSRILGQLAHGRELEFKALFSGVAAGEGGRAQVIVHFLALLELMHEALLEVTQEKAYAPILIRLAARRVAA